MNKIQLIDELKQGNKVIVDWMQFETQGKFNEVIIKDKWTIAGHLYHLIKSQRAINYGIKINKVLLWYKFGLNKQPGRDAQTIKSSYTSFLSQGFKAPDTYSAKAGRIFIKDKLIHDFETATEQIIESLDKWNEKQMDKYQVPHPALGKLTIREILIFNNLHNAHHLKLLQTLY